MAVTINGTTGILAPDIGIDGTTLTVDAVNDRIGIGTTSPASTLDVLGTGQFKSNGSSVKIESSPGTNFTQLQLTNTGGSFYVGRENNSGNWFATGSNYASVLRSDGAYPMIFRVNSENRLHITSAGLVGIGTDNPTGNLHVGSGSGQAPANSAKNIVIDGSGAVGMGILFGTAANTAYGNIYWGNSTDGSADGRITYFGSTYGTAGDRQSMVFRTSGSEALRINSDGKLGIGLTNPDRKLSVGDMTSGLIARFIGPTNNLFINNDRSGDIDLFTSGSNDDLCLGTASTERLRIDGDGKIHTGNPSALATDDFNITATGTGSRLSLIRAQSGNASDNDLLGALSFQTYASGQGYTSAESGIRAYAEPGQSGSAAPSDLRFYTKPVTVGPGGSASERLIINSSGILGVNKPPETDWASSYRAIEIGNSSLSGYQGGTYPSIELNMNCRGTQASYSAGWKRILGMVSTQIHMPYSGTIHFRRASSDSADSSITWLETMRLTTEGTVNINTGADGSTGGFGQPSLYVKTMASDWSGGIHIENNSNTQVGCINHTDSAFTFGQSYRTTADSAGYKPYSFYCSGSERLRIGTGGELGIGSNLNPNPYMLSVATDLGSSGALVRFKNSNSTYSQDLYLKFDSNKDLTWEGGSGNGGMVWKMGNRGYKMMISNVTKLQVQPSATYITGTTDGVLNLNTTDGRGSFIRFQENGTTKVWVGSGEGMGQGDQDDACLMAVDNIYLRNSTDAFTTYSMPADGWAQGHNKFNDHSGNSRTSKYHPIYNTHMATSAPSGSSGSKWMRFGYFGSRGLYRICFNTTGGYYGPGSVVFDVQLHWTSPYMFLGNIHKLGSQYVSQVRCTGSSGGSNFYLEAYVNINSNQVGDHIQVTANTMYATRRFNIYNYGYDLTNLSYTSSNFTL